jgi:hypothetical protein
MDEIVGRVESTAVKALPQSEVRLSEGEHGASARLSRRTRIVTRILVDTLDGLDLTA